MYPTHRITIFIILAMTLLIGCDEDENARVAKVAMEAARQQADQNKEMAKVNHTVAETQKKIVTVHREIQTEREGLNTRRDELEAERKAIAKQRLTESWIGPVVQSSGILVVSGLAIVFCLLLIFGLRRSDTADADLNDLLICELTSEQSNILPQPKLLSEQSAIKNESPTTALPSADN